MSHSTTDRLQQPDDRMSWLSLPSIQSIHLEESEIEESEIEESEIDVSEARCHRLSLPSPVSRPPSFALNDDRAPISHNVASTQIPSERDELLEASRGSSRHSSISTISNRVNTNKTATAAAFDPLQTEKSGDHMLTWLPFTLRRPFLIVLASVSLLLAVILAIVCWYSATHHGVWRDDGSLGLFVGWRYVPTLIAVLFTQALVMTAEDVKRTEAFARMAQPEPVEAKFSLFYIPKVWWKSVFEGFSRTKSGGKTRRWMLAFSSLAAGISILAVSTLSSSVLASKEVVYKEPVKMQRYIADATDSIQLVPRRETYFHTISGYLYNASTSIWVDDSHVVLPFMPISDTNDNEPLRDGRWQSVTTILQLENECAPMSITSKIDLNGTYTYTNTTTSNHTWNVPSRGFRLRSADGCEVQMQTPIAVSLVRSDAIAIQYVPGTKYLLDEVPQYGGIIWTNMSSNYVSWQDLIRASGPIPRISSDEERVIKDTFIYDLSDQCRGRDLLLVTPPWLWSGLTIEWRESWNQTQQQYWDNFTVNAEVCTPTIYGASLPVQQIVTNGTPELLFDRLAFAQHRKPMPRTFLDLDRLNDLAFHDSWTKYMTAQAGVADNEGYEGVGMLLGERFSLELKTMLASKTISAEASRLRSRFFGELILSSVSTANEPTLESIDGEVALTDKRIIVVTEIAIPLIVLFLLAFSYFASLLWALSTGRRRLHLWTDPAPVVGSISVLDPRSSLAEELRRLNEQSRKVARGKLEHCAYTMQAGLVTESNSRVETKSPKAPVQVAKKRKPWRRHGDKGQAKRKDWRPSMLHKRWLATLLAVLIAVAITLMVLRRYAIEKRLYRTAFVHQFNLGLFNTSFSPHSVIAVLVAVAIGLSWDGIDKPMRTLQPYLSMSRGISAATREVCLSYQSSYWLWASFRAALRRHWILALVTTGTTLAQILIISMAAIFERRSVLLTQPTWDFDRRMYSEALRQEPFDFERGLATRPFYLDYTTLKTTDAEWLYKALDEISLNNTPPAWTKDEWVFTPVDMSGLPLVATVSQDTGLKAKRPVSSGLGTSPANVSITTSALRSRLKCSNIRVPTSGWLDRAEDVFADRIDPPITGWVLPTMLFPKEDYKTPVFTVPRRMACCANGTVIGGQSAIAFWSSSSPMTEIRPAEPVDVNGPENLREPNAWTSNFAIKWILGPASSTVVSAGDRLPNHITMNYGRTDETLLYFTEEPQMSMMSCEPIIEHANASVVVARSTSMILEANLLSEPELASEAWEYAWDMIYPEPTSNSSAGNVSYGHLFMSQLLTAPHIVVPSVASSYLVYNHSLEDLSNERFSIRDSRKGINMDFMSYANYHLAGSNATVLLNNTKLFEFSEKTFQTFFKHYASTGKWAYGSRARNNVYDSENVGDWNAERANGTFTERIEILAMNETATWLSLSIIFLLIIILVVLIVSLQVVYPSTSMQHHVECLADVLLMVAGSDELVELVHERGIHSLEKSGVEMRLGWFKDKRGAVRWGIEVANGDVEWVGAPQKDVNNTENGMALARLWARLRRRKSGEAQGSEKDVVDENA